MPLTMRAAAAAAAGPTRGLRRLFSTGFVPPMNSPPPNPRVEAEPSTNLFVSGLNKRTTSEGLHKAFSAFGEVVQARVVTDRVSGFSKGFGFVRYSTLEDAAKGKQGMDGQFLDGWVIFAEYARPRTTTPPPENNSTQYGRY
ncbi:organelle RRM domain-containing protein 2, mitochondrial [Rosa rugosa]|uniref:organelle RRM domain-containing protein 2, mitochondrial n=1 Tax=Rosa rugosa TaxID=74645 RepID=UPI002B41257B|nr:organelle RRM domain-containing protein 2, mitochondrial [Rosa rugosa]